MNKGEAVEHQTLPQATDASIHPAFHRLEERVRRDTGRVSLAVSVLCTSILFALVYGLSWRLNVVQPAVAGPKPAGPLGPVVPVGDPGKFGIALDAGDLSNGLDEVADDASEAANALDLDPLNILQAAERNQFNDVAQLGRKAKGQNGRFGRGDIGQGPDGVSIRRADRWVIEWGNDTETAYRRKLDHFGIYIGAVRAGRLVGAFRGFEPGRRQETANPPSLWFVHQDRARVELDRRVLSSTGLNVLPTDIVAQFFPQELQERLASLEERYSHKNAPEIKKTMFGVRAAGAGYEFFVVEQQLK